MRVCLIDKHLAAQQSEATFNCKHKYGFWRNLCSTTDDTTLGKHKKKHIMLITGDKGFQDDADDDGFKINPFFECLSTGESTSGNNKSNAELNFDILRENLPSIETLSRYSGNTSDNATRSE